MPVLVTILRERRKLVGALPPDDGVDGVGGVAGAPGAPASPSTSPSSVGRSARRADSDDARRLRPISDRRAARRSTSIESAEKDPEAVSLGVRSRALSEPGRAGRWRPRPAWTDELAASSGRSYPSSSGSYPSSCCPYPVSGRGTCSELERYMLASVAGRRRGVAGASRRSRGRSGSDQRAVGTDRAGCGVARGAAAATRILRHDWWQLL
ncbi:uncharacterized protein V1510DRAFT_421377 [Dipodascopsis tothii]|uniref:uncharacterized protein n=1 Tax=Dipodascopsis tothii TaxID=44089 RepID=UPI0034CD095C